MHLYNHCSVIYYSQDTEATQDTDEWVKTLWYPYMMEYYLAIKSDTYHL